MKNKVKLGLIITAISLVLVGCNSNTDKENTSNSNKPKFENSYSVLAEKIKGQNGEWPRVVISEPKNINAKETEDLLASGDDIAVVDVRSKGEYDEGHIDRAQNIDFDDFENNLTILDDYKEKPVLLYCKTGNRSEKAAKILQKHGFKKVYNATDGVEEHDYKLVK